MKKAPLSEVRERFESKEALVDAILASGMLAEADEAGQDELKSRLLKVPSSKLLRLQGQVAAVRDRFGGRDALIDALCGLKFAGRKVEDGWRAKAAGWSSGKLLDLHTSLARRAARTPAGAS